MGRVFLDSGLTKVSTFLQLPSFSQTSGRMTEVVKKWTPLSAFVLTGGNISVSITGVPITLKSIAYLSVINGRAVTKSTAGEYEVITGLFFSFPSLIIPWTH